MRLLIFSDIHGNKRACEHLLEAYNRQQAHYLVGLGDLLNHGPRNPLSKDYSPLEVAEQLNEYRHHLLCVRGNCDSEVDQHLCQFPMSSDYQQLLTEKRRIFLTHGHHYSPENLPPLVAEDVFVSGHTHRPIATQNAQGIYLLNPGSIAIPRDNFPPTYAIVDRQHLQILELTTDRILMERSMA